MAAVEAHVREQVAAEIRALPTEGFGRKAFLDLHAIDVGWSTEQHALMSFAAANIADQIRVSWEIYG